jgi:hypothetical protein
MFLVRTAATRRPPKEVHFSSQDRRDPLTSEGGRYSTHGQEVSA